MKLVFLNRKITYNYYLYKRKDNYYCKNLKYLFAVDIK